MKLVPTRGVLWGLLLTALLVRCACTNAADLYYPVEAMLDEVVVQWPSGPGDLDRVQGALEGIVQELRAEYATPFAMAPPTSHDIGALAPCRSRWHAA